MLRCEVSRAVCAPFGKVCSKLTCRLRRLPQGDWFVIDPCRVRSVNDPFSYLWVMGEVSGPPRPMRLEGTAEAPGGTHELLSNRSSVCHFKRAGVDSGGTPSCSSPISGIDQNACGSLAAVAAPMITPPPVVLCSRMLKKRSSVLSVKYIFRFGAMISPWFRPVPPWLPSASASPS